MRKRFPGGAMLAWILDGPLCRVVDGGRCSLQRGLVLFSLLLPGGLWCVPVQAETPQRLSQWLKTQSLAADAYLPGLMWQVPEEEAAQERQKQALLTELDALGGRGALRDWLARLPVTGRVPVAIADADWLAANAAHDPLLHATHRVVVPARPSGVGVLTSDGRRCYPHHQAGAKAKHYLRACLQDGAEQVDRVWLVQADGKVAHYGVASWNGESQPGLAPGAWLWAPLRGDGWPRQLSDQLAALLATQGVATVEQVQPVVSAVVVEIEGGEDAGPPVSANDWGGVGLLQTPTARMRGVGHGSMTYTQTDPYEHLNFFLQPLDGLEAGFRYTSVQNRLYGPAIAGNQPYKDKSIDIKLRLLEESRYVPTLALGLRDITGTGLFSGEYLVAGKRYGRSDWSLGLGWGYLGGRGNLSNPLTVLGSRFDTRIKDVGQGGTFAIKSYFRGPVALFGGVQYQTAWTPLSLKLEYDGNDYQHEPQNNNQRQDTPWNVGLVYRPNEGMEAILAFERGNLLTFAVTLHTDLKKLTTPKLLDPLPVPVREDRPSKSAAMATTVQEIERQTGWHVAEVTHLGNRLSVVVQDAAGVYWRDRLDRASAVLHRDAGSEIDLFSYVQRQGGMDVVEQRVDRQQWVAQRTQPLPPSAQYDPVAVRLPEKNEAGSALFSSPGPWFEAEPGFGLRYNLGGPDGFLLYQFYAEGKARLNLREDTWLQGNLQLGLLDNYDKFKYTAPSKMPRVRTHLREYLTTSKVTLPNLQLTHVGQLTDNQFYSVYGGYLENMFAGFGAEWLYRPLESRWALGVDVNRLRQRGFRQDFELHRYRVDTGHATLYWDTGWNDVQANLSAGQYLAGDKGVTVEMSRVFQNGVRFGGYFSKTNVSAKQFGEGSFDKALYVSIPFDAMLIRSTDKVAHFVYKPLIRDGGAKLARGVTLYDLTWLRERRSQQYRPAELDTHIPVPSQRPMQWGWED